ncbi:hypothetical protein FAM15381_001962 [Propionibacterium freudenreichii]|uniref:DUF6541 family protein n=1 Tax=Propionibacterium freudenreichii TaxID=1744 RepID=UPI00254E9137|nr:DUF6541 family protein [Propionibacterium freudenreichii]MDK9651652.1 hypothetical protein [Propionibacterium freudenreichii]
MSWLGFCALVAASVVLLMLPGGIVNRCAKLPRKVSLALAPGVSTAIIAASAIVANKVGLGWNLLPPALLTVVCALGCLVVRWLAHRLVDARTGHAPHADGTPGPRRVAASVPASASASSGSAASPGSPEVTGSATRGAPRPPATGWWLGAGALGMVLTAWHIITILGRPDNFSQSFDNVFHLSAIRWILDNSNGSSLAITMTTGDNPAAFYPLAWHDVATLALKMVHSTDVVAANNAMVVAVPAVVWVLGCFYLLHVLGCVNAPALVAAGLMVGAFPAFPYLPASWGVLYPNMFGIALIPATIALAYQALGLGEHRTPLRSALPVGLLAMFGMAIAHPNTIALFCVVLIPMLATWLTRILRARDADQPRWQRRGAIGLTALAALVIIAIWAKIRPPEDAAVWNAIIGPRRALWQALTMTPSTATITVLPISVLVVVGAVVVIVTRRQIWLLAAHGLLIFLWMAVSCFPSGWLRNALVGIWYNDPSRLAAALPLTALPLAVIGCSAMTRWLVGWLAARRQPAAPTTPIVAGVTLVLAVVLVPATLLAPTLRSTLRDAADSYRITWNGNVVDTDEYALIKRLPELVPADETVATVPYNGSSMAYALENVKTTTTHILYTPSRDVYTINQNLRFAEFNPEVCHALNDLNVHYALDFGWYEVNRSNYAQYAPGFSRLYEAPGFVPVANNGHAVLYRIEACR